MTIAVFRPLAVLAAACLTLATTALADPLPAPKDEPILEISGKISNTNQGNSAVLDRVMLESLGLTKVKTQTPWYEEAVEFEGVSMKTLMDYVGAQGTEVTLTALNDYQSTVPFEDFEKFDALLALKRDGKPMPVRDKGPLWLIYPFDSSPELNTDKFYSRSVWQIKEMKVQ